MNVPSRIFPTFLYVSKYWHHWWYFLRAPVSQSSGLATWENNSWSPLAGVCVCVCVCLRVYAHACVWCACVWLSVHMDCVRAVADTASCVPRGPQMRSEPLLWPGLCKFVPLGAASASPVGPEVLLFPVTLEVTTLLLPSPLPSVFRLRGSYFLLYLWWIRATPGMMWTHCVWTPENLWVGACLLVFIYEASFLETTMTVNPELLNLMKCK